MNARQRLVVITGMSGAGKSHAIRFFEDRGYYCVDNLPAPLLPQLVKLFEAPSSAGNHIAACIDARFGKDLEHLPEYIDQIRLLGFTCDTVYLDSSDDVLHQRYSESRRPHPSSPNGTIELGIAIEREILRPIRDTADLIIDTSNTSPADMREHIAKMAGIDREEHKLAVEVLSFGFKYGLPHEADLVLDVRFLPNPYWDEDLRQLTGMDPEVCDCVINNDEAKEFFKHSKALLKYLMPRYEAEHKSYLTIAIGCTGGRHRSVAVAHEVLRLMRDLRYEVRLRHRDIAHDPVQSTPE